VVYGTYYNYYMFVNMGSSGFMRTVTGPLSNFGLSIGMAAGDFNNDGKMDLATGGGAGSCSGNGFFVHLGTGDSMGSFFGGGTYGFGAPCGANAFTMATGNLDGDTNVDLVLGNTMNGGVYTRTYAGQGNGTFPTTTNVLPVQAVSLILADVNSDTVLDIVTTYQSVSLNVGRGNGTFRDAQEIAPAGSGPPFGNYLNPRVLASGDFNGDGKPDLVVADTQSAVNILMNQSQ
jgi:hypothetical protein